MLNNSGPVSQASHLNTSSNSSIFSVSLPSNFNSLTDTITIEGQTVIFTHYWTVEDVIKALAPVWIILYILLSIAVFYYSSRYHNAH